MQLTLAAIGKWKSGPEKALFEHYAARLKWKLTLREHDITRPLEGEARMEQEGAWLAKATEEADLRIALDEGGKELNSVQFARWLGQKRDEGARHIAFIIGGADGLAPSLRERCALTLCFGRVTWPHLLVRGLLAEQLYRAHTILSGHPYHRE